ncbi:Protein SODIUM POTASSIUM ROOT DEFECTIVE 1 [Linum grandiflorum]
MEKLQMGFGKVLDRLYCLSPSSNSKSCFCLNYLEGDEEEEQEAGFASQKESLMLPTTEKSSQVVRLKDAISASNHTNTLAYQLKPKMVVLRVSMHCSGCARKVEKHVSKIDGVRSYKVDLESKRVVVIGDVLPYEVLHSVCKVNKNAQLWI